MITLGDYDSPFGTITIVKMKTSGTIIYEQGGHTRANATATAPVSHTIFTRSLA